MEVASVTKESPTCERSSSETAVIGSRDRGRVTRNVEPFPTTDVTERRILHKFDQALGHAKPDPGAFDARPLGTEPIRRA